MGPRNTLSLTNALPSLTSLLHLTSTSVTHSFLSTPHLYLHHSFGVERPKSLFLEVHSTLVIRYCRKKLQNASASHRWSRSGPDCCLPWYWVSPVLINTSSTSKCKPPHAMLLCGQCVRLTMMASVGSPQSASQIIRLSRGHPLTMYLP